VSTALLAASLALTLQTGLSVFENRELAQYRLTAPVFEQFGQASRLIGAATRADPRFADDPLFTREVALLGDAREVAARLDARLQDEPVLAHALRTAGLTSREYTKFALGLLAARVAHGFVASGVLRNVPEGPAADNIRFVDEHQREVAAVLKELGIVD
jgi:hypothetical protein